MMNRYFYNKETQDLYEVEMATRKEMLEYLADFISGLEYSIGTEAPLDGFGILYKDGSFDWIDQEYDGHKIRKINIVSMVWNGMVSDVAFGNFEINECGIVTASEDMVVSEELVEVDEDFVVEEETVETIEETIEETTTVEEITTMIENDEVELVATHKTENGQNIFTVKQGKRSLAYCYKLGETWKICFALVVKKRRCSKELLQQ